MKKVIISFIILLVLSGCETIDTSLDNIYDLYSPRYGGNSPVITKIENVPGNVDERILCNSWIKITWVDSAAASAGFILERSINNTLFIPIASFDNKTFTYTDTITDYRPVYYYRLRTVTLRNISPPGKSKKAELFLTRKSLSFSPPSSYNSLCYNNPDLIAFVGYSDTYVYNTRANQQILKIKDARSRQFALSNDGSMIVTYQYPKKNNIYSIPSGTLISSFQTNTGNDEAYFSKDNTKIFLKDNNTLKCWDIATSHLMFSFPVGDYYVNPGKGYIAYANSGNIFLLDDSGIFLFQSSCDGYGSSQISPNGRYLIWTSSSQKHFLDIDAHKETTYENDFRCFGMSYDGKFLFSDYILSTLQIFYLEDGKINGIFSSDIPSSQIGALFSYPEGITRSIYGNKLYEYHFKWKEGK